MSSPTEQFKSLVNTSDFVFVVCKFNRSIVSIIHTEANYLIDYRGHWCPFCESYLRDFGSIVPEIRTAGGTPIVITAEAEEHQRKFLEKTWCAADAIVDPENQIAGELAEKVRSRTPAQKLARHNDAH
jgi:peroxiredoxin